MYKYYSEKLAGERLRRAYEVAPVRVRRYLEAEIDYVVSRMTPGDRVVELGCGYGRVLPRLAEKAGLVVGIDTSLASLLGGRQQVAGTTGRYLLCMDALHLAFKAAEFDCVVCIQNGISAFHVDRLDLLREAVRVTRPGGKALFSTYAAGFWEDRLEWFRLQAEAGILGDIDYEKTRDGVIVCKDGFTATTVGPDEFLNLTRGLDVEAHLIEVDGSSLFCEIVPR